MFFFISFFIWGKFEEILPLQIRDEERRTERPTPFSFASWFLHKLEAVSYIQDIPLVTQHLGKPRGQEGKSL